MERGIILIWSGSIATIPSGFVLCNGNNGSPDLRDKFIVGAGDTYAPAATGGGTTHTHDFTSDGHGHNLAAGAEVQAGTDFHEATTQDTDSGTTDASSSLPPYYALAFIMKT